MSPCPRSLDLELERSDSDHVPGDPFGGRQHDPLGIEVPNELRADAILRIDREVRESGEARSQGLGDRGFRVLPEEIVLFSSKGFDLLDVPLFGFASHAIGRARSRRISLRGYIEYRLSLDFESNAFSCSPKWAAGIFASTSVRISVAAEIF